MFTRQRSLTRQFLQERRIDFALFANPATVNWLTGFAPPTQLGAHPYAGAPPLVWYEEGAFSLIVVDGLSSAASAFVQEEDGELLTYTGYTYTAPLEGAAHLHELLMARWANGRSGRTGVELAHVPASVMGALWKTHPGLDMVPVDGLLAPLRAVKTEEEIATLRLAFHLADVGHAAARRAAQPGMREIDVWAAVHTAIEREAGRRIALGNDCIVGTRPFNVGGWPADFMLVEGGSLIVDLSPIVDGYWADSCATYVAGKPTEQQRELHSVVSQALALGASMLRPGTVAGDIDHAMRELIRKAGHPGYPHHSGHGVGVTGHETPRIIPNSTDVLQAGMVVLLEPGIYLPGRTGVRLEDAFLITPTGPLQLTTHDKSLG